MADDKPTNDAPPPAPKRGLPSVDELRARGFLTPKPSGKGFVLPLSKRPPKKD